MSLVNATAFSALDVPYLDYRGREVVIAIVKGAFEVDPSGVVRLSESPGEIRVNDVPYDPQATLGSLRFPSDVCEEKNGTDVVVVGHAISPKPVTSMDLGIKIRTLAVPLRVHGPRLFYKGVGGVLIGPAAAFERVAVVYEKAYGGATKDWGLVEERNLAGVGVAKRESDLVDTPAPQIEHPARPHTSAADAHPPVGYGAIPGHWSPRKDHVGTIDAAWRERRMPLLPENFDLRYMNVAHPSLILDKPLVPGDVVAITGMSEKPLVFSIPPFPIVIRGLFGVSPKVTVQPHIDTLLVLPEARRIEIIARASFPLGRGKNTLREVHVDVDS